jgi:hypothetical protein
MVMGFLHSRSTDCADIRRAAGGGIDEDQMPTATILAAEAAGELVDFFTVAPKTRYLDQIGPAGLQDELAPARPRPQSAPT